MRSGQKLPAIPENQQPKISEKSQETAKPRRLTPLQESASTSSDEPLRPATPSTARSPIPPRDLKSPAEKQSPKTRRFKVFAKLKSLLTFSLINTHSNPEIDTPTSGSVQNNESPWSPDLSNKSVSINNSPIFTSARTIRLHSRNNSPGVSPKQNPRTIYSSSSDIEKLRTELIMTRSAIKNLIVQSDLQDKHIKKLIMQQQKFRSGTTQLGAGNYKLELMSNLPKKDKNRSKLNTIYISPEGNYVVRDPQGIVQTGYLSGIDLSELPARLKDNVLIKSILEVTNKAGHTQDKMKNLGLSSPQTSPGTLYKRLGPSINNTPNVSPALHQRTLEQSIKLHDQLERKQAEMRRYEKIVSDKDKKIQKLSAEYDEMMFERALSESANQTEKSDIKNDNLNSPETKRTYFARLYSKKKDARRFVDNNWQDTKRKSELDIPERTSSRASRRKV